MNNKWLCAPSTDTEVWQTTEFYDTKKEAIETTKKIIQKYNTDTANGNIEDELGYFPVDDSKITSFAVGQAEVFGISVDVDDIFERIQEEAYDRCGDSADSFFRRCNKEHKEELETLILDWFDKHNYKADFYTITNVDEIVLEVE